MQARFSLLVLAVCGLAASTAFATPARLRGGPAECQATCSERYQKCIAAGNLRALCDRNYQSCMSKCEMSGEF